MTTTRPKGEVGQSASRPEVLVGAWRVGLHEQTPTRAPGLPNRRRTLRPARAAAVDPVRWDWFCLKLFDVTLPGNVTH